MINNQRLQMVKDYRNQNWKLPSYREIAKMRWLNSMSAVKKLVDERIWEWLLMNTANWLQPWTNWFALPAYESVQAWFFTRPVDEVQTTISLQHYLVNRPESTFMVKVRGDSMVDAGILPDDYVLVDFTKRNPIRWDIVIAEHEGEVTLKYYDRDDAGKICLRPWNSAYQLIYPWNGTSIQGTVTGVVRKY